MLLCFYLSQHQTESDNSLHGLLHVRACPALLKPCHRDSFRHRLNTDQLRVSKLCRISDTTLEAKVENIRFPRALNETDWVLTPSASKTMSTQCLPPTRTLLIFYFLLSVQFGKALTPPSSGLLFTALTVDLWTLPSKQNISFLLALPTYPRAQHAPSRWQGQLRLPKSLEGYKMESRCMENAQLRDFLPHTLHIVGEDMEHV